jgi:hypothetical protein
VTSDPKAAYEAVKRKRTAAAGANQQQQAHAAAFPGVAETRLHDIETSLQSQMPDGLTLDTQFNTAGGHSSKKGIKGLYLKIIEGADVGAQGSINIDSDGVVEFMDHTDFETKRRSVPWKQVQFGELDDSLASSFLCLLIGRLAP